MVRDTKMIGESMSAKKVRRPLFQEEKKQMEDESGAVAAEASNTDARQQIPVLAESESEAVPSKDSLQNSTKEVGNMIEDVAGEFTHAVTTAVLVELDLTNDMYNHDEMSELEQVNFHAELVDKMQSSKAVQNRKQKATIGKVGSRRTTPLRGMSTRKQALMSPRKTPKSLKPKEGKSKKQDKFLK